MIDSAQFIKSPIPSSDAELSEIGGHWKSAKHFSRKVGFASGAAPQPIAWLKTAKEPFGAKSVTAIDMSQPFIQDQLHGLSKTLR